MKLGQPKTAADKPLPLVVSKKQDAFWRELNHWFAQLDAQNYSRAQSKVPPPLNSDIIAAYVSRNRAFQIVDATLAGISTDDFPRGMERKESVTIEKKKSALRWVSVTGKISSRFVVEAIHQAAQENDTKFFRASLPNALNEIRDDASFFVMRAPSNALSQLMVSLWCGTALRPYWADADLPPLCICSDSAIADLLCLLFPNRKRMFEGKAIEKCRTRLGLIKLRKKNFKYVSQVTQDTTHKLVFNSDI